MVAHGYYVADSAKYHVPNFLAAGATAILCGNDLIASGVITECRLRGFSVPDDISVVGFDDLPISSFLEPPLTTVRQERTELGKCGYAALSNLINHVSVSMTLLRPQLITRASTAPCAEREEEAEEEKKRQEQLCELMSMYQHYRGIVAEPQYVPRGSKLRCQYGTEFVQLDCFEDYGIYRGIWPLLTTLDCRPENIHNFGSCLCPEANYRNRLPMTVANTVDGKTAIKAIYNEFPHICIPLVDEENGWRQVKKDLLVEANAHRDASVLLSNAVLVCQYGGIITIVDVLSGNEDDENKGNLLEQLSTEYIEWLIKAEGTKLYPYIDEKDNDEAKSRKNVTLGPGITFDSTTRNWDILETYLGWTEDDINTIITDLYDRGVKYSEDSKYAITLQNAKQILNVLAQEIYIPDVNRAIEAYRDEADEEVIYSQRELEAMFDYSFNTGLSATADTGYTYSSSIDNPDKIIYYYLRKDLQGAVGAVKKFGNEGNRRRINQLYLFFKGYKFIDGADEALKPHRDELGF